MSARVQIENDAARIILSGILDYSTQDDIQAAIGKALEANHAHKIEVDLAGASFMDSSVIRALVTLQKTAKQGGKSLALVNCNENIRNILVIGGFDRIFTLQ